MAQEGHEGQEDFLGDHTREEKVSWRALVLSMAVALLAAVDWNLIPRAAGDAGTEPAGAPVENALPIPVGTILPAKLDKTLSVGAAKPGDPLEARIMQEVPLPGKTKIAFRAVLTGSIVSAEKDKDGKGIGLTLHF